MLSAMTPTSPMDSAAGDPDLGGSDPTSQHLSQEDRDLMERARASLEMAWCPYSGFRVGVALRCEDGRVFTGCNVENASYGLTICAERTAAVKAVSEGSRRFEVMALITDAGAALLPCGACRQFLIEFAPDLRILAKGASGELRICSLKELLPDAFVPGDLTTLRAARGKDEPV